MWPTYPTMHLVTVVFQVILDAALEEVQFGLQLLCLSKHIIIEPCQAGVVVKQTQPAKERDCQWDTAKESQHYCYSRLGAHPLKS